MPPPPLLGAAPPEPPELEATPFDVAQEVAADELDASAALGHVTEPVPAVPKPLYVPVTRDQPPAAATLDVPAPKEQPAGDRLYSGRALGARPKRVLALAAASTALVAAAVGAAVLAGGGGPKSPSASGTPIGTPHRQGAPSTSAPATTVTSPPTTTTAPPARPASLVSATAGSATYQLHSAKASIVVKASGPCWIEVKAGSPQGQVVYEGTLAAGQTSSVTGPAWIRLGDPPYASVAVNGMPMHVPGAEAAVPMNLQFTVG